MKIHSLTAEAVADKVVAIRCDFNVPLTDGKIAEDTRIVESIPTLEFLLKSGAKRIHIFSHLGRPAGEPDPALSLKIIAPELEKHLKEKVEFRTDFNPGKTKVQLHENVRFFPGEKINDHKFIHELLKCGAEVFVNEAFATSHRAHASVVGMAHFLPSYPGLLLQKEIEALSPFLETGKMPGLSVIIGGAKILTKVAVLTHFAKVAENVMLGGALGTTFLAAEGFDIGKSFYDDEGTSVARDVIGVADANKTGIHFPIDVICAESRQDIESVTVPVEDVEGNMKIYDIGPHTLASFREILAHSQTIIWNGPMGVFENKNFEKGTKEILKVVAAQKSAKTILGGGDTLEALKKFGVEKTAFSHVSTGGGAMLKFLEGKKLPGIEVLESN